MILKTTITSASAEAVESLRTLCLETCLNHNRIFVPTMILIKIRVTRVITVFLITKLFQVLWASGFIFGKANFDGFYAPAVTAPPIPVILANIR